MILITMRFKADGGSHAYAKGISSYFAAKDLRCMLRAICISNAQSNMIMLAQDHEGPQKAEAAQCCL